MNIENDNFSETLFYNYLTSLIDKVYKILPLKESETDTLQSYLNSLQIELIGSTQLISVLKNDPKFLTLLNIIQYFISNDFDQKTCKREVFKCIRIIESLQKKYFS